MPQRFSIDFVSKRRYSGQYYDLSSGTYYLRARNYAPTTGRFLTEDPARYGLNWYVYANSDPVNHWDPSGHTSSITGRIHYTGAVNNNSSSSSNKTNTTAAMVTLALSLVAGPAVGLAVGTALGVSTGSSSSSSSKISSGSSSNSAATAAALASALFGMMLGPGILGPGLGLLVGTAVAGSNSVSSASILTSILSMQDSVSSFMYGLVVPYSLQWSQMEYYQIDTFAAVKRKPGWIPTKDSKKGSENRQPSGEREKNIGHPNAEEHGRVTKKKDKRWGPVRVQETEPSPSPSFPGFSLPDTGGKGTLYGEIWSWLTGNG